MTASRPRVVVGVDGSEDSIAALRWAIEHARRIDAEVHAVMGWTIPFSILLVPTYTEGDYARDAHEVFDKAVAAAVGAGPHAHVVQHFVQLHPSKALARASEGAELLVIGSHGANRLPGVHLGSVASYCVHHAPCPVVVIRH